MADFFLARPVFAWVLALLTMLAGTLSLSRLPVEHYPDIVLPQIAIAAQYPGASSAIVDQSVTQVLERQIKGLDNLLHISSSSSSSGDAEIILTFQAGTNADMAQSQVQNLAQQALSQLPERVQRQGVQVFKAADKSFLTVAFYDQGDTMRGSDIGDYVASHLIDPLSRVGGVGKISSYGFQNAMRIWVDPDKMRHFRLNPADITAAVREQNAQSAGGQTGAAPAPPGQEISIALNASSALETVEQFEDIVLRGHADGSVLRLKDVARIELNSEFFGGDTWFNGHQGTGIALKLAAGANVVQTAREVKAELTRLAQHFPPGLTYALMDDHAPIVEKSLRSVASTLLEAILLVVAVIFVFLHNPRAALIPTLAVPVVLLGVFAGLAVFGFSINTLTLFGMVLAIGLLVDDAIVVVENTERLLRTPSLDPRTATQKSMRQITGALVGVAAVIAAAFIPMAFLQGPTGGIFRQFSFTIVTAMILSALVAIILTPTLCARLLYFAPPSAGSFADRFNRGFAVLARRYVAALAWIMRRPLLWALGFVAILGLCGLLFLRLPTAFLPNEDQGSLSVDIQLPPGATQERTEKVVREVEQYFQNEADAVDSIMSILGWSGSGSGQNAAMLLIQLKDWSERGPEQSVFQVVERARRQLEQIAQADVQVFAPPAAMELGASSGFELQLLDRSGAGREALMEATHTLVQQAAASPLLDAVRFSGMADAEQYDLEIDAARASALGLSRGEINAALSAWWAGEYINDFNDKGRSKQVHFQAEPAFRTGLADFSRYFIRNAQGTMTPLVEVAKAHSVLAAPQLTRYQGTPAARIEGDAAPGRSSGEAMREMERLAATLPAGIEAVWAGLSWQEKNASGQASLLYTIAILCVFLALAALYESWSVPFAVLLGLPAGLAGSLTGAWLLGKNNDLYFQIAVLTIIGLSAKNAILIVEFAKKLHEDGKNATAAALEAARLRLRPVLMTSFCFILGVLPLTLASGPGAGAQQSLGTAVLAGMLTATGLGLFYTPIFFVLISQLLPHRKRTKK